MSKLRDAIDYQDINLYSLSFKDAQYNDTDEAYESVIHYKNRSKSSSNSNNNLTVATAQMRLLTYDPINLVVELEFLDDHPKFYEIICSLDNCIIDGIHRNSKKMFGKELTLDTAETLYQKTVKLPLTLETNPRMILSVDKKTVSEDDLKSVKDNCTVSCVISFNKIKFYKNRIITDIHVVKLDVTSNKNKNKNKNKEKSESESSYNNLTTGSYETGSTSGSSERSIDNLIDDRFISDQSSVDDSLDELDYTTTTAATNTTIDVNKKSKSKS